jgi:hypothetical protein
MTMTNEERYKAIITEAAMRIAQDLDTIATYCSTGFYTDDDDDLNTHYVSDQNWFQDNYPFRETGIEALQRKVLKWARHLQKES